MAKPVKAVLKLQLPAGAANPAPPVGPALGQHGVNIQQFCTQFNEATKEMRGDILPAIITIYEDRTFEFKLKTSPVSALLRKALGVEKGSANPLKQKIGKVTKAQVKEIAEKKMVDLNAHTVEQAEKIVAGSARSMGVDIE